MLDKRTSASPFGLVEFLSWDHPWNRSHNAGDRLARTVASLKEAGAAFVRMDMLWSDIEPEKGKFDFSRYDRIIELLSAKDIKVLGLLAYSPGWDGKTWNQAPDSQLYCRYARAVVHRYKDHIRHWEIWNEPDHEVFWQPQDQMRAYTRLLQKAYAELKEEDTTCVVHLAGLTRALPGCLRSIYDHGGRDYFDVVNIHAFANPRMKNAIGGVRSLYEEVRHIMKSHDDEEKQVWLSQVACPGMKNPESAAPWWLGPNMTEEQQAAWVKTIFTDALGWPGIGKIFWSFLRDTDHHFNSGVDYFGLLRNDFSKKPAFETYRKLAQAWSAVV